MKLLQETQEKCKCKELKDKIAKYPNHTMRVDLGDIDLVFEARIDMFYLETFNNAGDWGYCMPIKYCPFCGEELRNNA